MTLAYGFGSPYEITLILGIIILLINGKWVCKWLYEFGRKLGGGGGPKFG